MYYTRHIATVTGATWKAVTCQYCGCEYTYLLRRSAKGEDRTAIFNIGAQQAKEHAAQAAKQNLNRTLSYEIDAVLCPDCGMYQDDMAKLVVNQKRGTSSINKASITLVVIGGIVWFVLASGTGSTRYLPVLTLITTMLVGLVIITLNMSADRKIKGYDPNQHAIEKRKQQFSTEYPVIKRQQFEQLTNAGILSIDANRMPVWESIVTKDPFHRFPFLQSHGDIKSTGCKGKGPKQCLADVFELVSIGDNLKSTSDLTGWFYSSRTEIDNLWLLYKAGDDRLRNAKADLYNTSSLPEKARAQAAIAHIESLKNELSDAYLMLIREMRRHRGVVTHKR